MKLAGDMERMMDQAEANRKATNDKNRAILAVSTATPQQQQQVRNLVNNCACHDRICVYVQQTYRLTSVRPPFACILLFHAPLGAHITLTVVYDMLLRHMCLWLRLWLCVCVSTESNCVLSWAPTMQKQASESIMR
jgi:hypothetical protein